MLSVGRSCELCEEDNGQGEWVKLMHVCAVCVYIACMCVISTVCSCVCVCVIYTVCVCVCVCDLYRVCVCVIYTVCVFV